VALTQTTASVTTVLACIQNLCPLPNAERRVVKRRTQSAERLTSSPYRNQLQAQQMKLTEKAKKSVAKKTKKSNKAVGKKNTSTSSSDCKDVKYLCIYCSEQYTDPPTEDWLQCPACTQWFHEKCGNDRSALCLEE